MMFTAFLARVNRLPPGGNRLHGKKQKCGYTRPDDVEVRLDLAVASVVPAYP